MSDDRLYFRQLLSGRDFAVGDIVDAVEADDMTVTGVLATHYHPDHVGGSMMGHTIEGVAALLDRVDCPIHIHSDEREWVRKTTGVGDEHLVEHVSGDVLTVGGVDIRLVHTPGHTPGSQCFLVDGRLVAGDTVFLEGCGRTDLPGSNPAQMADSLRRLAQVPDDTILFPGHRYSAASSATMDTVKQINFVFDQL